MSNKNIFTVTQFDYPNDYIFPGKQAEEEILFVTREDKKILTYKKIVLVCAALVVVGVASFLPFIQLKSVLTSGATLVLFFGWFYLSFLWKQNMVIVTTSRVIHYSTAFLLIKKNTQLLPNEISGFSISSDSFISKRFNLKTLNIKSKSKLKPDIFVKNISQAKELQEFLAEGIE